MHRFGFPAAVVAASFTMLAIQSARANDSGDNGHSFRHVFVIVLENEGYNTTFGPGSKAPYLSQTLTRQGVLLSQYYGTGHASLDNYIAMISGQAATPQTRNDCQEYQDFALTGVTPDGQAIGSGCIYPDSIKTLPDQLKASGKTWRAYMGDMGNDPKRESATCGHPALNTKDLTQIAEAPSMGVPNGDQYASRHNPFVYFHSIIDSPDCNTGVVNLNQLTADLKSESSTPDFVFITPNLCDDGHDAPCVTGQPGGLVSADAFLRKWIPAIQSSPAYQKDGLIAIIFDEGGYTTAVSAGGAVTITFEGQYCCSEQPGPNLAAFPQSTTIPGTVYTLVTGDYGGDRTGAVLLSPLLKPGTVSNTPFNHFSLLKTLEDIYHTDGYLGYAGQPGLLSFFGCVSSDIKPSGSETGDSCKDQ
jgi:phosphatidylinositol-3-phosphatase